MIKLEQLGLPNQIGMSDSKSEDKIRWQSTSDSKSMFRFRLNGDLDQNLISIKF